MNSNQVKQAFAAAGLKIRVKDLGLKFRVCPLTEVDMDKDACEAVARSLGFTDALGYAGAHWSGMQELVCYKPGSIRRV